MAVKIDWLYHRKNCVSCQRARDFIEHEQIAVADQADARKDRRDPKQCLALAKQATKHHRRQGPESGHLRHEEGSARRHYSAGPSDRPDRQFAGAAILKGKTLLIGFNEEAYRDGLA